MNSRVESQSDHDEVIALLPWFVNKTLDQSQIAKVSNHIKSCEECQREIQFLTTLHNSAQDDAQLNYQEHADVELSLSSVMDRIDTSSNRKTKHTATKFSIYQKLSEYLKYVSAPPSLKWTGAALACSLVVVLGVQLNANRSTDDYFVLSSQDVEKASMRFFVRFVSGTNDDEQTKTILESELGKIDWRSKLDIIPDDDGYLIVFKDVIEVEELSELISNLERNSRVDHVEIRPALSP